MTDPHTKLEAVGTLASKASYAASGGLTFFGVLSAQDLAALVGIVIAVLTLITNIYINWHWRKKAHELKLSQIARDINDSSEEEHRPG